MKDNKKWHIVFGLFFLIAFFTSCQKWEIDRVDLVPYEPEITLPITANYLRISEIIEDYDLDPIDTDTLHLNSDVQLIEYEGQTYACPDPSRDTAYTYSIDFAIQERLALFDRIRYIELRSNFYNYSNTVIRVQGMLYNSYSSAPFDSLYHEGPITVSSGSINSNGTIKPFYTFKNDVWLDSERMRAFLDVVRIDVICQIQFESLGDLIRYESDEIFKMQLGTKIGLYVELD